MQPFENGAAIAPLQFGQGAYQHSKLETTIMTLRHRVVAIVENDPSMLQGVENLLHVQGYMTECYCSAEAFLAAASKATCLILDIGLDGMSGIELRRRLAASGSTLAVVFMTGDEDEATRQQAIEAGCVGFLLKPFPADCLLAAINESAD